MKTWPVTDPMKDTMDARTPLEYALVLTKIEAGDMRRETARRGKVGIFRDIPVNAVLATAWNPGRLERCRRHLEEGNVAPRIRVMEVRRPGHPTIYTVEDGMHRTVAARDAEMKTIRAEVTVWITCDPARFFLFQGVLYDTVADNPDDYRLVTHRLKPDVIAALLEIGVIPVPDDAHPRTYLAQLEAYTASRYTKAV